MKDVSALEHALLSCIDFPIQIHTFHGSGLAADILEGLFITTVRALISSGDDTSKVISVGIDAEKKCSRLKALMECVERYSIRRNPCGFGRVETLTDDYQERYGHFLSMLDPSIRSCQHVKHLFAHGVSCDDMLQGEKTFVPLAFINPRHVGNELTSYYFNNGVAAHQDAEKAKVHSLLELIERDAFMRWWLRPEECHMIAPPGHAQKRIDTIQKAFIHEIGNKDSTIKLFLLPSPLKIAVVMALLTSRDTQKPPALIVGTSAAFMCADAIDKALDEVCMGALNLFARAKKNPSWQDKKLDHADFVNLSTPTDHSLLYHDPALIPHLRFLPHMLEKTQTSGITTVQGARNIDELVENVLDRGMRWYLHDSTPPAFQVGGIHVVRSVVPALYPLYFGFPLPFDHSRCSALSIARILPHCFP